MIYPDLFNYTRLVEPTHIQEDVPLEYYAPSIVVKDKSVRHQRLGPSTIVCERNSAGKWDDFLHPEILSTCKTIYREASPILEKAYYSEQVFHFYLNTNPEAMPSVRSLERHCEKLFDYRDTDWQQRSVPPIFQFSTFAAFIRKIGKAKAAKISNVEFIAGDCDAAAGQLPLLKQLIQMYLPGLRQLELHVSEKEVCYDESPDYFHPDRASPFWMNGDFRPMYSALDNLVDQITWLRRFWYSGQSNFGPHNDGTVSGWQMLKGLEVRVRDRRVEDTGALSNPASEEDQSFDYEDSSSDASDESGPEHDVEDLLGIMGSVNFF